VRSYRYFKSFLQARLSREGFLGLHLTLGILFLSAATWLFADLAEDVANGDPLTLTDARFSNWLHAHATPSLTRLMLSITHLHSTLGVTVMTLAISILLWRRRLRHWVFTLLVTVYGGMLLNFWLKAVFQRARPHFEDPVLILSDYSFPSGHTMMATVFYGTLSAIVISFVRDWKWRAFSIIVAMLLTALVGFTRIYLGVHYLSDVLGAMTEGAAWLALCLTATETMRRRRRRREAGGRSRRQEQEAGAGGRSRRQKAGGRSRRQEQEAGAEGSRRQ
jgi:membrane-associated phospholipid phosphatase